MEDSAIGVVVVGLDGRIIESNPAFAAMLGYARHELETLTFFQITHPDDVAIGARDDGPRARRRANSYHFEKRYLRKDGRPVWARLSGSVIRDSETGAPLLSGLADRGHRRPQEVRGGNRRGRDALELRAGERRPGPVGLRRRKRGSSYYSPVWKQMLGYGEDELDTRSGSVAVAGPSGRPRCRRRRRPRAYRRQDAVLRSRVPHAPQARALDLGPRPRQGARARRRRAMRSGRSARTPTSPACKQAEERLTLAAAHARRREGAPARHLEFDRRCGDLHRCRDLHHLHEPGRREADRRFVGARRWALPSTRSMRRSTRKAARRSPSVAIVSGLRQRVEHNNRAVLLKKDGSRCSIREVVSPILNEQGEFSGSVIVFQDFTDARTLQRELAHAAAHDSLTGLANRASLLNAMSGLVANGGASRHASICCSMSISTISSRSTTPAATRPATCCSSTWPRHDQGDGASRRSRGAARRRRVRGHPQELRRRASAKKSPGRSSRPSAISASSMTARPAGSAPASASPRSARGGAAVDEIMARADHACYEAKAAGRGQVVVRRPPGRRRARPNWLARRREARALARARRLGCSELERRPQIQPAGSARRLMK